MTSCLTKLKKGGFESCWLFNYELKIFFLEQQDKQPIEIIQYFIFAKEFH